MRLERINREDWDCRALAGFDFEPELRQLKRSVELARKAGDFRGPGEHFRVAGAHGEIGPGVGAQFRVAALQGEFTDQCLEDGAGQQVFRGSLSALPLAGRLGRGFAGSQDVSAVGQSQGDGKGGSDSLQLHGRLSIKVCARIAYWNA